MAMSPLVIQTSLQRKEYCVDDVDTILNLEYSTTLRLWVRALGNSSPLSDRELKLCLADCMNKISKDDTLWHLGSYHALFHFLYNYCVLDEWNPLIEHAKNKPGGLSKQDVEDLDKRMMKSYHDLVVARDGSQCQRCFRNLSLDEIEVHHIWQRRNSQREIVGPSTFLNLVVLCKKCHLGLTPWMKRTN